MDTEKDFAGVIKKGSEPVAVILMDKVTRVPTLYSLERLNMDQVIELMKQVAKPEKEVLRDMHTPPGI